MKMMMWALGMVALAGQAVMAQSNLCCNGTFSSPKDPLEGWTIDYGFTGSTVYMDNRSSISFCPEHLGRKQVLRIAKVKESKVETPVISFEQGTRYQCTMDVLAGSGVRIHFNGYDWKPGVEPYEKPQLKDLRQVFKGDSFAGGPFPWRMVTVAMPHPKVSPLAQSHLRKIRFITVEVLVPADYQSDPETYIANVKITKIGKYTVSKESGD